MLLEFTSKPKTKKHKENVFGSAPYDLKKSQKTKLLLNRTPSWIHCELMNGLLKQLQTKGPIHAHAVTFSPPFNCAPNTAMKSKSTAAG